MTLVSGVSSNEAVCGGGGIAGLVGGRNLEMIGCISCERLQSDAVLDFQMGIGNSCLFIGFGSAESDSAGCRLVGCPGDNSLGTGARYGHGGYCGRLFVGGRFVGFVVRGRLVASAVDGDIADCGIDVVSEDKD